MERGEWESGASPSQPQPKARRISLNASFGNAQMGPKQELPPLETLREKCDRVGHLKKLCGRGILSAGTWKDRTCVLYQNQLFLYEKRESGEERGKWRGVVLDLGHLDNVAEAPTRVTRKAANVFLLGSAEKGFFESSSSTRHYFAAKSLSEMKEWVSILNSCIESEQRRKQVASTASLRKGLEGEAWKMTSDVEAMGTLPRSSRQSQQLDCGVSKSRPKGPAGRRLPRSKKSMDTLLDGDDSEASAEFRDEKGRATSLSALEETQTGAVDLRPEPRRTQRRGREFLKGPGRAHAETRKTADSPHGHSTSEDDEVPSEEEGGQPRPTPAPQVSIPTPTTFKLTRRSPAHGNRGGTPLRYSASMTPPPCLLRKLRHEMSTERNQKLCGDDLDLSSSDGRASSRSSLSTLTDDHHGVPNSAMWPCTEQPHSSHPHHLNEVPRPLESENYKDTSASLQRKLRGKPSLTSPQVSARCENGHSHGCGWRHGVSEEVLTLRATVEMLKEKVARLTSPLTNAARHISTTVKETNDLREETLKICQSAKTARGTLEKLTAETETLLTFLRQLIREHETSCAWAAGTSCCSASAQTHRPSASPLSMSKGKELERSLECIAESSSYVSVLDSLAQAQMTRQRSESEHTTESSEMTSSDNESSIVQKTPYHKT